MVTVGITFLPIAIMKTCERALHTKNYRPVAYLGRGGLGA